MTILSEKVQYTGDNVAMEATLYIDGASTGRRPGVLVFPEAMGPGPNIHDNARKLAEAGYVAMACDIHGGARMYSDMDEVIALLHALYAQPERTGSRARGALEALAGDDRVDPSRIAAIGYCFGGTMALELGRFGAPLAAIAGFHCGLAPIRSDDAANIKAKVLVCIGADDPAIPAEQRIDFENEMRAGKVDWTMHIYGGVVHGFTNPRAAELGMPDFSRYDAQADQHSWKAMIALLSESLPLG